ncbi:MAG: nitroreductase family protein [Gammaproteobacteria bacterium]|nr:nitroreductase family protein [Gammaproteobacteria bacterium]
MFRLIDEPAEASSIAGLAMGTRGYSEQVPALVVVIGDFSSFALERDRHLPYIDSALASMQFMLALETLGLASCPINWPDIESLERRMSRRLELPDHLRPVLLIAVGYPNPQGGVAHSEKKPVSLLLRSSNDYRD